MVWFAENSIIMFYKPLFSDLRVLCKQHASLNGTDTFRCVYKNSST